jgi:type II pantothenate kinase
VIIDRILIVELDNGEMIYLKSFPSTKIGEFLTFAKEQRLVDSNTLQIHATGGGAYKYNDLMEKELTPLGIQIKKHDEMESLVNGMSFILNYGKQPAFTYN